MDDFGTISTTSVSTIFSNTTEDETLTRTGDELGIVILDTIILSLGSLTGIFGNTLLILAIIVDKHLHTVDNLFVLNVAVIDLFGTAFPMPVAVANIWNGGNVLSPGLCDFSGVGVVLGSGMSIIILSVISINRYVRICMTAKYPKIFNKKTAVLYLALIWIWTTFAATPPLWGWGKVVYKPHSYICAYDQNASASYSTFVSLHVVVGSIVTYTSYYLTHRMIQNSAKKVSSHEGKKTEGGAAAAGGGQSDAKKKQKQKLYMFIMISVLFTVFWTPYMIVVLASKRVEMSPVLFKYVSFLGWSNSSINCFVYGAMNKNFRAGYKKVLCCGRVNRNNGLISVSSVTN